MKKKNKCNNCDECVYKEKRFDGVLICQHRQSMLGLEAIADYVLCSKVTNCVFFRK